MGFAVADAESVVSAVLADYATATAMANNGTLYSSHAAAWSEVIWSSRVEFVGYVTPCALVHHDGVTDNLPGLRALWLMCGVLALCLRRNKYHIFI